MARAEPFDPEKAALVAMLEAMGYRDVKMQRSLDGAAVLIKASRPDDLGATDA